MTAAIELCVALAAGFVAFHLAKAHFLHSLHFVLMVAMGGKHTT